MTTEASRRVTLFGVLAWIFSIVFGIPAIAFLFTGSVAAGVWLLIAALVLFPPLATWLQEHWHFELSKTLRIVLAVICFVGYAVTLSQSAFHAPAPVAPVAAVQVAPPPSAQVAPASVPAPARVRSATILVDRVTTALANLQPIRVTVTNTGTVPITPKFDVTVIDARGSEVCSSSPLVDEFDLLAPGEAHTGEFSILGCTFGRDGRYTVRVDLLDSDFTKLGSDTKNVTVAYWSTFS